MRSRYYRDLNIAPVARKLKNLKEEVVRPELLYFGREAMELSRPIIRPLWMLNPLDKTAQRYSITRVWRKFHLAGSGSKFDYS